MVENLKWEIVYQIVISQEARNIKCRECRVRVGAINDYRFMSNKQIKNGVNKNGST